MTKIYFWGAITRECFLMNKKQCPNSQHSKNAFVTLNTNWPKPATTKTSRVMVEDIAASARGASPPPPPCTATTATTVATLEEPPFGNGVVTTLAMAATGAPPAMTVVAPMVPMMVVVPMVPTAVVVLVVATGRPVACLDLTRGCPRPTPPFPVCRCCRGLPLSAPGARQHLSKPLACPPFNIESSTLIADSRIARCSKAA